MEMTLEVIGVPVAEVERAKPGAATPEHRG
jgi:hypothetical protein